MSTTATDWQTRLSRSAWLVAVFWYLLAALTVPSQLQASTVGLVLLVVVLVLFGDHLAQPWRQSRGGWLLIGAALLLGVLFSEAPEKSAKGLYDALRAFGLFFVACAIASHSTDQRLRRQAGLVFTVAALLLAITALGLGIEGGNFFLRGNRLLNGHLGNLHEFANLTAVTLLLLACVLASAETPAARRSMTVLAIGVLAAAIALAASDSRGNWLATAFCAGFIASHRRPLLFRLWSAALLLALGLYVFLFFFHAGDCLGDFCPGGTYTTRKQLFHATLSLFTEQPWFGHGINTFKAVSEVRLRDRSMIMPHSIYLELLFSSGVVGSLLFCLGGLRLYAASGGGEGSAFLRLTGKVILLYALLRGLVDMKLFSFEYLGILSVALGLLYARPQRTTPS